MPGPKRRGRSFPLKTSACFKECERPNACESIWQTSAAHQNLQVPACIGHTPPTLGIMNSRKVWIFWVNLKLRKGGARLWIGGRSLTINLMTFPSEDLINGWLVCCVFHKPKPIFWKLNLWFPLRREVAVLDFVDFTVWGERWGSRNSIVLLLLLSKANLFGFEGSWNFELSCLFWKWRHPGKRLRCLLCRRHGACSACA